MASTSRGAPSTSPPVREACCPSHPKASLIPVGKDSLEGDLICSKCGCVTRGSTSIHKVYCLTHPLATLIEDSHAGDLICPECGLVVVDRVIDVASEWRTFGNDKTKTDPSRVGAAENPFLEGNDLGTIIGGPLGSASFNEDGSKKYRSKSNLSSTNRTLRNAFQEIGNMADRINLPKIIVDRASTVFKQVKDQGTLRGRSNNAIAAACLYSACRQEGVPRTFKEISAVSSVNEREIGRCFKALETNVKLATTGDFMSRFCSNLSLPPKVQRAATHIARKADELDLVHGRGPISVTAAAIYMASQASEEKRSQKEIGEIAGVADATIRQSYKLIYPRAHDLFPQDFQFATKIEDLPPP